MLTVTVHCDNGDDNCCDSCGPVSLIDDDSDGDSGDDNSDDDDMTACDDDSVAVDVH